MGGRLFPQKPDYQEAKLEGMLSANFTSSSQGSTDIISNLVGFTLDQVGLLSREGAAGRVVLLRVASWGLQRSSVFRKHISVKLLKMGIAVCHIIGCYRHPFYRGAAGIQWCGAGKAG